MARTLSPKQKVQYRRVRTYLTKDLKLLQGLLESLPPEDQLIDSKPDTGTPAQLEQVDCPTLADQIGDAEDNLETQQELIADAIAMGTILEGILMDLQMIYAEHCT